MVYGWNFNWIFKYIDSLGKHTQFVFGLVCSQYGDPQYESFDLKINSVE